MRDDWTDSTRLTVFEKLLVSAAPPAETGGVWCACATLPELSLIHSATTIFLPSFHGRSRLSFNLATGAL